MTDMNERMKEYEGLVISTVRYWRHMITTDMDDEEIAQELRFKVWRALETFDPERGYPERKHVFGAVRNRVKDLIGKRRREHFESPTGFFHDEAAPRDGGSPSTNDRIGIIVNKLMGTRAGSGMSTTDKSLASTDLLVGLEKHQQQVAILMVQGYNAPEIACEVGVSVNAVRSQIARIREHVSLLLDERSQS